MSRTTGHPTGTNTPLIIIDGRAHEITNDETEFGIGEGFPHDYIGTTPQPDRIIGVGRSM